MVSSCIAIDIVFRRSTLDLLRIIRIATRISSITIRIIIMSIRMAFVVVIDRLLGRECSDASEIDLDHTSAVPHIRELFQLPTNLLGSVISFSNCLNQERREHVLHRFAFSNGLLHDLLHDLRERLRLLLVFRGILGTVVVYGVDVQEKSEITVCTPC